MSAARKLTNWEAPRTLGISLQKSRAANDNAVQALDDARENSRLGIFVFAYASLPACEPANDGIAAAKSEAQRRNASEPGITGKEEDVEVGLQYFGKRYLNPLLGRWISADPLAVHAPGSADLNVYAYVSGAVVKDVDPLGLSAMGGNGPGPGASYPGHPNYQSPSTTVVSGQVRTTTEYKEGGVEETAQKIAQSEGVSKAGKHSWSSGLVSQVERALVKQSRVDTVGHTASGLIDTASPTRLQKYTLSVTAARKLAPHLTENAKIVIHGCGHRDPQAANSDGGFNGTTAFLKELPKGAVMYSHKGQSQPGMAINWVKNTLVTGEDGSQQLETKILSGDDKVVGEILSKGYVESWAKENFEKNPNAFRSWLAGEEGVTITNDVREIMQNTVNSGSQGRGSEGSSAPQSASPSE